LKVVFFLRGFENLGAEYISAILKKNGHELSIVFSEDFFDDGIFDNFYLKNCFNMNAKQNAERILNDSPEIVLFSSMTDTIRKDLAVAFWVKRMNNNINILFGGIHPTLLPERVLNYSFVDFVCVGEGEKSVSKLIYSLSKGIPINIKGIWYKQNGKIINTGVSDIVENLDEIPFADKGIFSEIVPEFMHYYRIITGRGCPYNCAFCAHFSLRKLYGKYGLRRRSPKNVIAELKLAKKKFNPKAVIFEDDLFLYDEEWLIKFLQEYREKISLPFQCTAYPSCLSENILNMLKNSGCRFIEIGVQTLNEKVRKKILNRKETNHEIFTSLKLLKNSGIKFNIFHITDIPGVLRDDEKKALELYLWAKPSAIHYVRLTYYPNTGMRYLIDEKEYVNICDGRLKSYEIIGDENIDIYNLFGLICILPKKIIRFLLGKKLIRLNSNYIFKIFPSTLCFLTGRASYSMRIYPLYYLRLVKKLFLK